MADQLRKLKRRQLLELLVAQGKELEAKQKALKSAQEQIAGLESRLAKMGAGVRRSPRDQDEGGPADGQGEDLGSKDEAGTPE